MQDPGDRAEAPLWRRWRAESVAPVLAMPDPLLFAAYAEGRLDESAAEPVEAWLAEHPEALARLCLPLLEPVRDEDPGGHREEREPERPLERLRAQEPHDEAPRGARERVVDERRDQDAGDDRQRPAQARREHQRQQLRLVAELADDDRRGRDGEGFQDDVSAASSRRRWPGWRR